MRIRIQVSFELDDPNGVHAKWPQEFVAAGIGTLIDEGKLPKEVQVWNERLRIDAVSAATLAKRAKGGE